MKLVEIVGRVLLLGRHKRIVSGCPSSRIAVGGSHKGCAYVGVTGNEKRLGPWGPGLFLLGVLGACLRERGQPQGLPLRWS